MLSSILSRHANTQPDKVAIISDDGRLTYREFKEEAERVATFLLGHGLNPGDDAVLIARNSVDFPIAFMALQRLGAVIHLWNYRQPPENLKSLTNTVPIKAFVTSPEFGGLLPRTESIMEFVPAPPGQPWSVRSHAPSPAVPAPTLPPVSRRIDDPSSVIFTSGTTGVPKGAAYTHLSQVTSAVQYALEMGLTPDSRGLSAAPLVHGAALNFWLAFLLLGSTFVFDGRYRPENIINLLQEYKVSELMTVPTQVRELTSVASSVGFQPGHLRFIRMGGSSYEASLIHEARDAFGCEMINTYGMTENCSNTTIMNTINTPEKSWTSIGRPTHFWDLRLISISADGPASPDDEVPPGERGQIIVRGPQQISSYYTGVDDGLCIKNGWFFTRDVAVRDRDGYLTIVDRLDEVIISGAENIYPLEVETVLRQHPGVEDVAVLGLPDSHWGEIVVACVVTNHSTKIAELDSLFLESKTVAPFKRPRKYALVDSIPRNAFGKVDRKMLKSLVLEALRMSNEVC